VPGTAAAPSVAAPTSAPGPGRVGLVGRGVRLGATLAIVVALLIGSFWGDDWMFPFGPLRMYSTSANPNGAINYDRLEARTPDGVWHSTALSPPNIGMNRAEVEGRTSAIVKDPSLLRFIAQAHARLRPSSPWTGVRLFKVHVHLRDGVPQASTEDLLATWTAS
jgi:hypothetical protein